MCVDEVNRTECRLIGLNFVNKRVLVWKVVGVSNRMVCIM